MIIKYINKRIFSGVRVRVPTIHRCTHTEQHSRAYSLTHTHTPTHQRSGVPGARNTGQITLEDLRQVCKVNQEKCAVFACVYVSASASVCAIRVPRQESKSERERGRGRERWRGRGLKTRGLTV